MTGALGPGPEHALSGGRSNGGIGEVGERKGRRGEVAFPPPTNGISGSGLGLGPGPPPIKLSAR